MEAYLERFRERLEPFEGSLVRPAEVQEPRAKHYLGWLAKDGAVERVDWGWYYVPARRPPESALEFLAQDRHHKVVVGQSAASFWNGDFIHREAVTVATDDASYARALKRFGEKRGWQIEAEYESKAREIPTRRVGKLQVEVPETAVVDCFQRWAFVDGTATLTPEMRVETMKQQSNWKRIRGTNVRVGQALDYAARGLFGSDTRVRISDDYVRDELDEAIEKVRDLG